MGDSTLHPDQDAGDSELHETIAAAVDEYEPVAPSHTPNGIPAVALDSDLSLGCARAVQ